MAAAPSGITARKEQKGKAEDEGALRQRGHLPRDSAYIPLARTESRGQPPAAREAGNLSPQLDRKRAVVREQRREEERCSVNISHVTDTVHGTAHPCVGKRMQPSPTPTGKGGKCCTVHGLTRRIHNVQPNLQSPILSAACVD
nr:LOW QUALITY PROTEIN: putative uncharacterized protein C9orf92 homolog [Equus caballus]